MNRHLLRRVYLHVMGRLYEARSVRAMQRYNHLAKKAEKFFAALRKVGE